MDAASPLSQPAPYVSTVAMMVALGAALWIEPLLFETAARDAFVIAGVAVLLAAVAVLASVIPAARAGRTSPLHALRAD